MTLTTVMYVHDPIDRREVFDQANVLIGGQNVRWHDRERNWTPGEWWLGNDVDQGLPALMWVTYRPDGPLRTPEQSLAHDEDCDDDCDGGWHYPACWLELDFDTAYSYRSGPMGCGDLHALLVAQMGRWLDERGIRWSWKLEYDGTVYGGEDRYERLQRLARSGKEAEAWFTSVVVPVIESGKLT